MDRTTKVKFLILILISSTNSFCQINQDDSLKKRIKNSATEMGNSFVTKDYEVVIKYMEPNTVNKLGGKAKLIEMFKKGLPGGAEIKSVEISYPSDTIISKGEIQCTLIETIKLKTSKGTVLTKSTLIGISKDVGQNWYFIDANRPIDQLKLTYPNLSDRLKIEPQSMPVLIEK